MKKSGKILLTVLGCLLICAGVVGVIFGKGMRSKERALNVAFFEVPESVALGLEKVISQKHEGDVSFSYLVRGEIDVKKVAKSCDLLFAWDGDFIKSFEALCKSIPRKCYSLQPKSFNKDGKSLLVCLNHYEIAYNKAMCAKALVDFPESFEQLDSFLQKMSGFVFCPFICEGSVDSTLLAFLSCIIEGKYGAEVYNDFLLEVKNRPDFNAILDVKFSNNFDSFSLRQILDELKSWPERGFTHPMWFSANSMDVESFMEMNQVAVVFSSLTEHRKMPFRNVEKYEACRFPVSGVNLSHGVIEPAVSCVSFNNSQKVNNLLVDLVSPNAQESVSNDSMLGPTSLQGQAFDRQADDVRFWGAACEFGPLPDLFNAVFQNDVDGAKKFAADVRNYLRS